MQALGIQILVEYYDCDPQILKDEAFISKAMIEACEIGKATVVTSTFHSFSPFGVSGVVVIAESHVSIHTWPEYGYAAVDIFTCGETIEPWKLFHHLQAAFNSKHSSQMELKRGLFDNGGQKLAYKPEDK